MFSSVFLQTASFICTSCVTWAGRKLQRRIEEISATIFDPELTSCLTLKNAFVWSANIVLFRVDASIYFAVFSAGFFMNVLFPDSVSKIEKSLNDVWFYTGGNHNLAIRISLRSLAIILGVFVLPKTAIGVSLIALAVCFVFKTGVTLAFNSSQYALRHSSH